MKMTYIQEMELPYFDLHHNEGELWSKNGWDVIQVAEYHGNEISNMLQSEATFQRTENSAVHLWDYQFYFTTSSMGYYQ